MSGAAGAFLLTTTELIAGTFAFLFLAMILWRAVGRGHYRATSWVLTPLLGATAFLAPVRSRPAVFIAASLMAIYLVAVYSQRPVIEWTAGAAATLAAMAVVAGVGHSACGCLRGAIHALAGGMFLGAVTHGMTLGHWYLNQPRLPVEPLLQSVSILMVSSAGVGLFVLATRAELVEGAVRAGVLAFSPRAYWWVWLALVSATALLGYLARSTARLRNNQAATGLLYVAMAPAIGAQFLADLLLAT